MEQQTPVVIGVDGGATEVRAHAVACDDLTRPTSFVLRPERASRAYERRRDFTPLPVSEQLAQQQSRGCEISEPERQQGRLWIETGAEAICDVARQCGSRRVLVGIGMPGLKTADGRGICVINNGPRIPDYIERLSRRLVGGGVELAAPIAALGSDADYCGLGEEFAAEGLFRGVQNAYYVGCGTGIADAMKLRGRLVPFDQAKSWILKSWQIRSALGPVFEQLVSAASLNCIYSAIRAGGRGNQAARPGNEATRQQGNEAVYPEQAAAQGEQRARMWIGAAALVLAELIFERLWTVKNGRAEASHRGATYLRLSPQHEFRGTILERVIIGQRVGEIYADRQHGDAFGQPLSSALAAFIAGCGDETLASACLQHGSEGTTTLRPDFLVPSRLRAAPALGAAVTAVRALAAPVAG